MKQIPTIEEYLVLFQEFLPKADDDLTLDDQLLALLTYINAATSILARDVCLYQELCGVDLATTVIGQFIERVEDFRKNEGGK